MLKKGILLVSLFLVTIMVHSQDKEYSEEELTKYAMVMVWADLEKDRMTEVYNGWINENEDLQASRFVKIKNASGDSEKLKEMDATEMELAAYEGIISRYDSMTSAFKEIYVGKIKDEIGAGLYNDLNNDLKKQVELKARYDKLFARLRKESAKQDEDGESEE